MAVRGAKGFFFLTGCVGGDLNTGNFPEAFGAQTTLALEEIKRDWKSLECL